MAISQQSSSLGITPRELSRWILGWWSKQISLVEVSVNSYNDSIRLILTPHAGPKETIHFGMDVLSWPSCDVKELIESKIRRILDRNWIEPERALRSIGMLP